MSISNRRVNKMNRALKALMSLINERKKIKAKVKCSLWLKKQKQ